MRYRGTKPKERREFLNKPSSLNSVEWDIWLNCVMIEINGLQKLLCMFCGEKKENTVLIEIRFNAGIWLYGVTEQGPSPPI